MARLFEPRSCEECGAVSIRGEPHGIGQCIAELYRRGYEIPMIAQRFGLDVPEVVFIVERRCGRPAVALPTSLVS